MGAQAAVSGPDFGQGVRLADLPASGTVAGRVGDAPVLVSRFDGKLFAVGGACTHYGAALADGLMTGDTVRCPLHHACFSLRTGAALRAPAFDGLDRWRIEVDGDMLFVRGREEKEAAVPPLTGDIRNILIVGGGAAGFACAERLRGLGYDGSLTMVSADADPPCDRPNLSKDYLAGTADEEWIPLKDADWYRERSIDLRLSTEIVAIDAPAGSAIARSGERFAFDRLLIATGSVAARLTGRGFDRPDVHVLRSLADARAIIARASPGAQAVIVGSSFIAMEVAASLRARDVEVAVVSSDSVPFQRILGREVGGFLQKLHEDHGVRFHLGREAASYDGGTVALDDGRLLPADFLIFGIGVRPLTRLAATAGLETTYGICVDERMETALPGIYAAGDAAAYPDPASGERVRTEHWVVAQRQGQVAAANMLGKTTTFAGVPFFWTEQYGTAVRYVGRASGADEVRIDGDLAAGSFTARYYRDGELRASASVGRDRDALIDELLLEGAVSSRANHDEDAAAPVGAACSLASQGGEAHGIL